jgi:hypothetical protein
MGGNAAQRDFCASWPNQQKVTVPGLHFFEEDSGATTCQACGEVAFITSLKGKAMTDVPLYMMVNSDSPEYERSLQMSTPSKVCKCDAIAIQQSVKCNRLHDQSHGFQFQGCSNYQVSCPRMESNF